MPTFNLTNIDALAADFLAIVMCFNKEPQQKIQHKTEVLIKHLLVGGYCICAV
jgi:hypothetical protein